MSGPDPGLFPARHALQMDTGCRRYDDLDVDFWHYDTVSDAQHDKKHIYNKDKRKPPVKGLAIRDVLG